MPSSHVLVLNCGSSSLKFAIIDTVSGDELLSGLAERLGEQDPQIKYKYNGDKQLILLSPNDAHQTAIAQLVELVKQLQLDSSLVAVGHRVVHGGEHFTKSALENLKTENESLVNSLKKSGKIKESKKK